MLRHSLVALCLLSTPVLAESELAGWGAKGSIAVVKVVQSMGTVGSVTTMVVYDFKAGTSRRFQVTPEEPGAEDQPGPDSPAWEKWQAANPLLPAKASQTSPDGKAKLEVSAHVTKLLGWNADNGRFDFAGEALECPEDGQAHAGGCGAKPGSVTLTVVKGKDRRTAAGFALTGNAEHLQPHWSPDGQHLLVLSSEDFFSDVGTTTDTVAVARLDGPSFEVLTTEPTSAATKAALAQLEKVDAWPVRVGKALKPRAATVIYAAKGKDAAAKTLAAAIPGATVDALTWKSDCDLVVALGQH